MPQSPVVTRFAPSPTGELHLGNARTALFNALLARHGGGDFLLRIEDTDAARSIPDHARALQEDLRWLGMHWADEPLYQSQRTAIYDSQLARLAEKGMIYPCFCTQGELALARAAQVESGHPPRYSGKCRELSAAERAAKLAAGIPATTRFAVPRSGAVEFVDLVHGLRHFEHVEIGDFVLRRADGSAAFFFSNAVDDALSGVTQLLRGDDHLSNTPRQLLILQALELAPPQYGHLALLTGPNGAPLSKRDGAVGLRALREAGILPLALVNYLFRLGHSTAHHELLSFDEMAAAFDVTHLQRSPAQFEHSQLLVWQKEAVHRMPVEEALQWLGARLPQALTREQRQAFVVAVLPNIVQPDDALLWAEIAFGEDPQPDAEAAAIVGAADRGLFVAAAAAAARNDFAAIVAAAKLATGLKGPQLFKPLRAALTGRLTGPELGPLLRAMAPGVAQRRLARFAYTLRCRSRESQMLSIHNSLSGKQEPFRPIIPGAVSMYVCGITVYDYCHIGHMRMLVAFDVIQRYLRHSGYRVTYVRNITDIDDKIIRRAAERGESIEQLTARYIAAMNEDAARMGVARPDHEPRATAHVPQIVALIARLIERGHAYVAGNGDVMYSVTSFAAYGELSGKRLEDLRAGARVDVDEAKRDPLDFVLWKHSKPGEPSWPAPWGAGRPGWHIECSAMSMALLGEHFDIHGGGMDLKFPHHENEIAQSCGATGHAFANYWLHNGFVNVDSEKMSKSLGNFFTLREVLPHLRHPEVLRYFLVASHYRGPINYTLENLLQADATLSGLYTALRGAPVGALPADADVWRNEFRAAMDDDFNTPKALVVLQRLARELNEARSQGATCLARTGELAALFREFGGVLGICQLDAEQWFRLPAPGAAASGLEDSAIEAAIVARLAARKARDFKEADRVRDELTQGGVILEDRPDGTTLWRRR